MSTTIANQLIDLNINLNEIYNQTAAQTKLIGDLYDTIESLSTPVAQPTPVLLVNASTGQVTSTLTQSQSGYVAAGTKVASLNLKDLANTGLIPSNIIAGATIFGVEGTASSGIDTSDATAKAEYLRKGTTAYVNGQKITGTAEESEYFDLNNITPGSTEIDVYPNLDSEKTYWISGRTVPSITVPLEAFGDATAANVRKNKTFTSSSGYSVTGTMPDVAHAKPSISVNDANGIVTASHTTAAGYTAAGTTSNTLQLSVQGATTITPSALEQTAVAAGFYTKGAVKVAGDIDLKAANIRNGVNIFNVTGTYTSDATADTTHILKDKIAYSKGLKITGSMANNGAVAPSVLGAGSSYTIPAGYHNGKGKVTAASLAGQTSGSATANDILTGKTAWVNGSKITGTISKYSGTPIQAEIDSHDNDGLNLNIPLSQTYVNGSVTAYIAPEELGDATSVDIRNGKTCISGHGILTGTMPTIDAISIRGASTYNQDDESIECSGTSERVGYLDGSTAVRVSCNGEQFGNATASDVRAGKTFTSTSGLSITGTAEFNSDAQDYTLYGAYLMSDWKLIGENYTALFDLSQYDSIKSYFYDGEYWSLEDIDCIDIQSSTIAVYSTSGNENFCMDGSWEDAWNSMKAGDPRLSYIYIPNKITVDKDFYDLFTRITEPQENLFEIAYELGQNEINLPIAEVSYF